MEPALMSASRLFGASRPTIARTGPFICSQCAQVRGKKMARGPKTVTIRLLKDMPGYGRKGSVVPVPLGQMRNWLLPGRIADYVPQAELARLKSDGVTIERDSLFGREGDAPLKGEEKAEKTIKYTPEPRQVDLNQLQGARAHELLKSVIPPVFVYRRTPISSPDDRRRAPEPAQPAKVAAPPPDQTPRQAPDNIYGSVSVADITNSIKALLSQRGAAGLIVLPDEDVKFVELAGPGSEEKADRVKALGEFAYEIRVHGVDERIRGSVRVLPDDVEPAASGPNYEGAGIVPPSGEMSEQRAESVGA